MQSLYSNYDSQEFIKEINSVKGGLSANQTFISRPQLIENGLGLVISILSDTDGYLYVDYDNILNTSTYTFIEQYSITKNNKQIINSEIRAKYFRIRFQNSNNNQNLCKLFTFISPVNPIISNITLDNINIQLPTNDNGILKTTLYDSYGNYINSNNGSLNVNLSENQYITLSGSSVTISEIPDVNIKTLPSISLSGIPDVNIKTLPSISLSGIPDVNIKTLPSISLSGIPDVNIKTLPSISISDNQYITLSGSSVTISEIPDVNIKTLPSISLSGIPEVNIKTLPSISLSGIPDVNIKTLPSISLSGIPEVNIRTLPLVSLSGVTNISGNTTSLGSKNLPFSQNLDGTLNVNISGIILNTSGIYVNSVILSNETSSVAIYGNDGILNRAIKTDTSGKIYTIQNNLNKTTDNITAILSDNSNNYINSINLPLTTNYGLITHNIFDYSYNQIDFSGIPPFVISNNIDINKYKNFDFVCENINIISPIRIYLYISINNINYIKTNIYFDINEYDTTYAMTNITINARYIQFQLQTINNISHNSLTSYILMKG